MIVHTPVFEAGPACLLPRPDRLYHQFTFHRRSSAINTERIPAILAEYGLKVRGKREVPGGPSRSENVIVETDAGKKLLKCYKQTVEPAAIRHEHSILSHLAQVSFPAPRLTPTARGETLIQQGDRYYALFDVLEGYFQYHNYVFLPAQICRFITVSGQTLGALHTTLRDFTPSGRHPQGFTSREGARWRELGWFISQLDWCEREAPGQAGEDLALMISDHAGWVHEVLCRMDEMLRGAELPRLIIHGDYGPYNLFFKPGMPVVILDFELARLDWRLTDLATALPSFARSRLGFSREKLKAFLEGYRTYCPVEAEELVFLPAVWQFLTLRRLIVCWYRCCTTGAEHWLAEARQRLKLAHWLIINHNTLLQWLLQ